MKDIVEQQVILAPYTTFHIGGPADYFVRVRTIDSLREHVLWAKAKQIPFFVLGSGANILLSDKGFRGLVIKNEIQTITQKGNCIDAGSGVLIADLITYTLEKGLSGFEHFAGIPSTVGGALWQNLHFLSPDRKETFFIEQIVEKATLLTKEDKIVSVGKEYFQFAYDWSRLHDTLDIVLSAEFRLVPEKKETIAHTIQENLSWRAQKHPKAAVERSIGSIFKKKEGLGAGRLIEKVGLKGKQIGGARIAMEHANFIVNEGGATAADVKSLIQLVQEKVQKELGVTLETEIQFIGEW